MTALSVTDEQSISPRARETFKRLQASKAFGVDLQRGVEVPSSGAGYKPIKCLTDKDESKCDVVGQIARSPKEGVGPEQKYSSFVLVLKEAEENGTTT
jgi:hypothetical protein